MKTVRFGIVGVGNMGSSHVKSLGEGHIKRAELAAVCDIKPERLEKVRAEYGDKLAYFSDYHEMLTSGKIDVVIIATPHYLHPVIAQDAFKAKVNVISEKPAGVYTKAVREMNEAAAKSGVQFGIMFNQRTNPVYKKAREMVQGGELGELKRLVWIITNWYRSQAYYDSGEWRATWAGEGGGVLLNQCPHNLDLWQWIFGMPKRVRADCYVGKYHNIEVEDDVTINAEYENGATATFITTTGECPGTNRLEISGDRGKIVIENNKLHFWKLAEPERKFCFETSEGFPHIAMEDYDVECPGENSQHRGILQNYTDALLDGTPLLAHGEEGINGLTLSNAAFLSSWTGHGWVDLPLDEDKFYAMLQEKIATSNYHKTVKETVFSTEGTYGSK